MKNNFRFIKVITWAIFAQATDFFKFVIGYSDFIRKDYVKNALDLLRKKDIVERKVRFLSNQGRNAKSKDELLSVIHQLDVIIDSKGTKL